MRTGWTNLILHTTALVYRRKQNLLVSHSFQSVFDVFVIIFLELFLALISLPLYLVSKESDLGGKQQYKIRRVVSLSLLLSILIIWVLKLIFVVAVPMYFDTRQAFFVAEKSGQSLLTQSEFILSDIYNAKTDIAISPPTVDGTLTIDNGRVYIQGKGNIGTDVVVTIKNDRVDNSGVNFYIANVDSSGSWSLGSNGDDARLTPGKYQLQAITYDSQLKARSPLSVVRSFEVGQDWRGAMDNVDVYLNYIVVVFLGLSIFSIVLLI